MIAAFFLAAAVEPCPVSFSDVARTAKLVFRHDRGATPAYRLAETMGSGLAWLDYDGDGWQDLYVVQSGPFPPSPSPSASANSKAQDRLFRNAGDGTFVDVTERAKLQDGAYGMGAAAADYDNDGFTDLFVTNWGGNTLYKNLGDGTFRDVTASAGVAGARWGTAAAWGDVDGDQRLDLYVANYVDDSREADMFCGDPRTGVRDYCQPIKYPGTRPALYRNRGDGGFADITSQAGLSRAVGKGLGVLIVDVDADSKPDLYQSNDGVLNFLFRNLGGGRFEDISVVSGTAFGLEGNPQGGMGTDAGDLDGDGRPDILVANFEGETNEHYKNLGSGIFEDVTMTSGFGLPVLTAVGFGLNLFDAENDGDLDVFIANGHISERPRQGTTYPQKPYLMWNDGSGRFRERGCGSAFATPSVGRGSAAADYDNDGDTDLAVSVSGGPLQLLRNDGRHGRWLGVELRGRKSNRQGVGSRLTAELASGRKLVRLVQAGSSYLSSSDPRVLFGLGEETGVKTLTIQWPSGTVQVLENLPADRYVKIEEK